MWMWKKMCSYKPSLGRFNGLKSQRGFNMLGDINPNLCPEWWMMTNGIFTMKAVGPMVGMPCQRNSYFLNQQNQLIKYIGFGSLKDLVAIGDPIKSLHWSPEFPSILNPSASMAARLSDLYCTAVLPISEGCLQKKIFWLTNTEWWLHNNGNNK